MNNPPPGGSVPGAPYRYDSPKPSATYLNLQPNEGMVLQAAAQVFAAYVTANLVTPQNEAQMIEQAVGVAIRMAQRVDTRLETADEQPDKDKLPV